MKKDGIPDIVWPEDRVGGDEVIAQVLDVLGQHDWIAVGFNPPLWRQMGEQYIESFEGELIPHWGGVAWIATGDHAADALRAGFLAGKPEMIVIGADQKPTENMIIGAGKGENTQPFNRALYFDGDVLIDIL